MCDPAKQVESSSMSPTALNDDEFNLIEQMSKMNLLDAGPNTSILPDELPMNIECSNCHLIMNMGTTGKIISSVRYEVLDQSRNHSKMYILKCIRCGYRTTYMVPRPSVPDRADKVDTLTEEMSRLLRYN